MVEKHLIVVLGMHRSGTSMLTRGLQALGIELGETLMPAVKGNNDKGFWEDTEIAALNETLLADIGSSWHSLAPPTAENFAWLVEHGYVERAAEILLPKLSDTHIFGLKDPRISKLLPFWKQVFARCGATVRYVVAARNPLSVARSLAARDHFHEIKSHYIWLMHSLGILGDADVQQGAVITDYDRMLDAPIGEIKRIASHFGLPIDASALDDYASTFLETSLRHSHHGRTHLETAPTCPQLAKDVYLLMLRFADGSARLASAEASEAIRQFVDAYHDAVPLLNYVERFESSLQRASQRLGVPNLDVEQLATHSTKLNEHASAMEHRVADLEQTLAQTQALVDMRNKEIESIKSSTSWRITAPLRNFRGAR